MIIFKDHMFGHMCVHKTNNIDVLPAHCISKTWSEFGYNKRIVKAEFEMDIWLDIWLSC